MLPQILHDKCETRLHELNLFNKTYIERLAKEIRIIQSQNMVQYFMDFFDKAKQGIKVKNSNHLLVTFLTGISDEDPIALNQDLITTKYAEFPDIDSDFEDTKRDLIKDYLIEKYGKDNVATIIAFNKAKAKNTIKDVCRVKNIPYEEVNVVTKCFKTVDQKEDTIEMAYNKYPEVKSFFDKYSYMDLYKLCTRLEGNVRQPSKHASGFVVSPVPLTDVVGLMTLKGTTITCWEEGIEFKELSKVGLVKFDLLGLRTITVIADTLRYIKERLGLDINPIALDLSDVKVLKEFYDAHTVGIFQFEKEELRHLMKRIKTSNFSDISAINALNRPGPLGTGMDEVFWKVKNGLVPEKYLHEKLEPILKETYTVILYQEQIIRVAQALAGYDTDEADTLRRIITKDAQAGRSKGINPLEKLEKEFIQRCRDNGITGRIATKRDIYHDVEIPSTAQDVKTIENKIDANTHMPYRTISCNVEVSDEIFHQIKSFANYGFNKCLAGVTKVRFKNFKTMKVETIFKNKAQLLPVLPDLMSFDQDAKEINSNKIVDVTESGEQDVYLLTTISRKKLICTANHKIRTNNGWKELGHIGVNDKILILKNGQLYWDNILTISYKGKRMTYDVSLQDQTHPYFFANNIAVHNSHSSAYAFLAFISMFLKVYYPREFMCKLLTHTPNTVDKKTGINDFINYVEETRRLGIKLLPPSVNHSDREFKIEDENIRSGFTFLKGVANRSIDNIVKNRPYKSMNDFLSRIDGRAVNKTVIHALVNSGSLDCFLAPGESIKSRSDLLQEFNRFRKNKEHADTLTMEQTIAKEAEVCGGEIFNSQFAIFDIKKINEKYAIDEKIMDFKTVEKLAEYSVIRVYGRIEKFFEKTVGFVDVRNGNDKKSFILWGTDLEFLKEHPEIRKQIFAGNIITFKVKRMKDYKGKKSFNILPDSIERMDSGQSSIQQ